MISTSCRSARWPARLNTVLIVPPMPLACSSRIFTRWVEAGGACLALRRLYPRYNRTAADLPLRVSART